MHAFRPPCGLSRFKAIVSTITLTLTFAGFTLGTSGCSDDPPASGSSPTSAPAAERATAPPPDAAAPAPAAEPARSDAAPAADPGTAEPQGEAPPAAEPSAAEEAASSELREPQQFVVKGVVTQWSPMVLFVQPGDQVVFRQMTGHDTETIEGMIPDGAEPWKSALGAEGFSVTLEVPGAYVYKCNPHVSTGMIGAIVVGDEAPANLDAIKASPLNKGMIGRAVRKLDEALDAH